MNRFVFLLSSIATVMTFAAGCGKGPQPRTVVDTDGTVTIHGDVWADNWFALYVGEDLLIEDSVSITTERSRGLGSPFKIDLEQRP